ncbi:MAG TPA: hypothetical protein VNA69_04630 [Thermoanaerobaculia bacterium]|nr:hypothetical protein [Thermoanaerobaculia bacterium]
MRSGFVLLALLVVAPAVYAQTPSADWRTVETPHFRVHYPRDYEAWALRAASRLESMREAVTKEVGFVPPQTIDVLVVNPLALPNGAAIPLLDTPRMIFFAEPPGPDEQIGAYGHWIDLLAVHEITHLVHLLRPTRNPWERLLEKTVLPVSPIARAAPRWVTEGYATVIEGRLTGAGRPSSTVRALILRRWAQNGRLPSYGQLNSNRSFLGASMAYLMGSAFLEWLEQRRGPDALRSLWLRLTARHRRSFDEAFTGVFGDSAERLYGRFVAEVTASAMAIDRASELREGELWQETTFASGDPAVSPDGKQIAVVLRPRDLPQRLVVWKTDAPAEEEKRFEERLKKLLERDPEDVAPLRVKPLPRKAVHELTMPDGGDIVTPRWTGDGKAIVFAHRVPDGDGVMHWDLYRWDFERLQRVTHLADVRDADASGVAVRNRYGASQLVHVNLDSGEVTPRNEASIDVVYHHPRTSGGHLAYVAHRTGRWTLFVDERAIELPGDASSAEWISDDALVVTVSSGGFAELYRVSLDGSASALTRSAGGAFEAAPSPDGRVFFMSLEPHGFVLRVLPADALPPAPRPPLDAALVPAIPPQPAQPAVFAAQELPPSRKYGIGRQELDWLTGQSYAPHHRALEAGIRLGDVVGRLDTLLIASIGRDDAPQGAALATAWRGWPVELQAHLFTTNDVGTGFSRSAGGVKPAPTSGVEVRASWTRRWPLHRVTLEGGALSDDFAFGAASFSTRQLFGTWRVEEALRVEADDGHSRAILTAALRSKSLRIAARLQHDDGAVTLGGLASSILPRSAYARRVLDPALPLATLSGEGYDGWRIESNVPSTPLTAFYQRHELGAARLSLAGLELALNVDPIPLAKFPGLDLTLGAARVFDAPLQNETKWWLGMRWRP